MRTVTTMHHGARVGKVLRYISVNLHRSFTVEELSRVACYAPYHFHRVFRQITGEPVHRYVRRLRLEVSAYHLLFTDDPIVQIALEAGYHSHEAYTRAFQQAYGTPPSRFRMRRHGPDVPSGALQVASTRDMSLVRRSWTERKLAFYPYFGSYASVAGAWRELGTRLKVLGISPENLPALGIVHDDPFRCREVRYDAAVLLPPDVSVAGHLGMQMVPEMECIDMPHQGPHVLAAHVHVRMASAWALEWSPRGLRRLPWYEVYERPPFLDGDETVSVHVQAALG